MANIISYGEAEAAAENFPEMRVWHANLANGAQQEFNWVQFEAGSIYPLHYHPYEQSSVVLKGRMLLTVGVNVQLKLTLYFHLKLTHRFCTQAPGRSALQLQDRPGAFSDQD